MWEELSIFFIHTFSLQDSNPEVCNSLQITHEFIVKVIPISYLIDPHVRCSIQSMMTCYNLSEEPEDDDELQKFSIPESEGSCNVAAPDILMDSMNQPLKIQKFNIAIEENPKFSNVMDYWDEETIARITDLLNEF